MVNFMCIRFWLISTCIFCLSFSQTESIEENIQFIKKYNPIIKQKEPESLSFFLNETSIFKLSALWYIRIYQNFISSQHDNHKMCTFIPSCSRFSIEAIKYYGLFQGILLTSDRLLRCNNFGYSNYIIDIKIGKRVDSIMDYATGDDL